MNWPKSENRNLKKPARAHVDEHTLLIETLNSIKRAGADMILTYYALKAASLVDPKRLYK
jgi:delta-aminolevulinic acid dehydratase/porphobilinogen synthase